VGGAADPTEGYDVYLLAGQSNMIGRYGPIISPEDDTDADIFMLSRSTGLAVTAADPLDHIGETANTIGLGLTFAKGRKVALTDNRKILLVCCAEGATGFDNNQWNIGGDNYIDAITQANTAMALDLNGGVNLFKGIIWHQGAAEGPISEASYRNRMHTLVVMLKANITGAGIATPFVCGDQSPWSTSTGVRAACTNVEFTLPYSDGVLTTGVVDGGDGTHWDAVSQRTMGGRYDTGFVSGLSDDLGLTAPNAPVISVSDGEDSQTVITVTAPTDLGGSAIRHYRVFYKISTDSVYTEFYRTSTSTTPITLTGLANGIDYDVYVIGNTSHSSTPASNVDTASTLAATVPDQVTGLAIDSIYSTSMDLSWTAPSDGGSPITDYKIEYKESASGTWLTFSDGVGTGTTATVTGLTVSTSYDFRVSAENAVGFGTVSSTVTDTTTSSFSPADIGSGSQLLWLDADDAGTITDTAGAVDQWDDKFASGNNVVDGGGKPATGSVTIGGKNAIDFDGSNDELQTAGVIMTGNSGAATFTIFVVSDISSSEAGYVAAWNRSSFGSAIYADADPDFALANTTSVSSTDSITRTTGVTILMIEYNQDEVAFALDGVSGGTNTYNYTFGSSVDVFTIGNRPSGSSAGTHLNGSIGEIVVYDTASLSTADKNAMGDYLAAKWSGTWTGL